MIAAVKKVSLTAASVRAVADDAPRREQGDDGPQVARDGGLRCVTHVEPRADLACGLGPDHPPNRPGPRAVGDEDLGQHVISLHGTVFLSCSSL